MSYASRRKLFLWCTFFLVGVAFSQEQAATKAERLRREAGRLHDQGKLEEAIDLMSEVIDDGSTSEMELKRALLNRATFKKKLGRPYQDDIDVAQGLNIDRSAEVLGKYAYGELDSAPEYFARGEKRLAILEDYEGAIEDFQHYLELVEHKPNNQMVYMFMAQAWEQLGKYELGVDAIRKGVELGGDDWVMGLSILERLLTKSGQNRAAGRVAERMSMAKLRDLELRIQSRALQRDAAETEERRKRIQSRISTLEKERDKLAAKLGEKAQLRDDATPTETEETSSSAQRSSSGVKSDAGKKDRWILGLVLCLMLMAGGWVCCRHGL